MKQFIRFTLQPLLLIFILISCKKDTIITQKDPGEKLIASKVNIWLTDQLTKSGEIKDDKIQLLKQNLNFKEVRFEEFRNGGKFIIIPLKEGFSSRNNKNKNPVNNLVLISDEKGTIIKGNVIQYIAANNQVVSAIPNDVFYQMYNDKLVEADGKFSILTLSDRLLYEMSFKNGIVNAFGIGNAGKSEKAEEDEIATTIPQDPIGDCIPTDWYLLTTYYYEDGSTSQTQEYLYTTCQPSTGGGGSTGDIEYEYAVAKDAEWEVAPHPLNGYGQILGYERIKGKRIASEPQGGHFTSIGHYWSICNFCSSLNPYNVWVETSNSVSIPSPQSATSTISGRLYFEGIIYYPSKTKNWRFDEIFH